ncbi:hypothetical protein [Salinicola peritrichatus]|uniref:hypothetical protein n=1 Tax=Salinicola peritrichatus TaxID=1267424 RepID=UPI001EF9AA24|nr:hypothetical protein [Salinicola peritrichatus]
MADIARNTQLDEAAVATYATAIREEGRFDGELLGVLGIFFGWPPQAGTVVSGVGLSDEGRETSRVMLLDAKHRIIADSRSEATLGETYPLAPEARKRGYDIYDDRIVAFAETPGYETYAGLGWYGVIEYRLKASAGAPRRRESAKLAAL